jgi:hypothetical protein
MLWQSAGNSIGGNILNRGLLKRPLACSNSRWTAPDKVKAKTHSQQYVLLSVKATTTLTRLYYKVSRNQEESGDSVISLIGDP